MKILIADPNRDLLMCFKQLFAYAQNEAVTAFDGAQAVTMAATTRFDVVILNRRLPLIDSRRIVKQMNDDGVPVIVLTDKPVTAATLLEPTLANAYLPFPFFPGELLSLADEVYEKSRADTDLRFGDVRIQVSDFRLSDTVRLTNEEINLFRRMTEGAQPDFRYAATYVNALNGKLRLLNKRVRVKYNFNEGYRLVTDDE